MGSSFITRGILIGGSLGALATAFGIISTPYFASIGFGMIGGLFAGITRVLLNSRRKKK